MGNKMCTCTEERKIDKEDLDLAKDFVKEEAVIEAEARPVQKPIVSISHVSGLHEGVQYDLMPVKPDSAEGEPITFHMAKIKSPEKPTIGEKEEHFEPNIQPELNEEDTVKEERGQEKVAEEPKPVKKSPAVEKVIEEREPKSSPKPQKEKERTIEKSKDRKYSSMQPEVPLAEPDLQIQVTDEEVIHFESELKKYKPGLSSYYITRWCQATPTHLNYYKSHWSANCWLSKPLMSIPFSCIQSVRRVNVKIPLKRKYPGRREKEEIYQFEIFLKRDVDVSLLSKSIDYSAYETRNQLSKKRPIGRNAQSCCNSIPRTKQGSMANVAEAFDSRKVRNSSFLEPSVKGSKGLKNVYDVSVSRGTPDKGVQEGHLMRTPSTYSKSKELSPYRYKGSMEISTSVEKKPEIELIENEGIVFISKRQQCRFELFRKRYQNELQAVVLSEEIGIKNPSAWIPTLSSK